MKATKDRAGRLAVPKRFRQAAGIVPSSEAGVRDAGGHIEIEPVPLQVKLVRRGSLTVAVPSKRVAALSNETVAQTLDRLRRTGGKDPDAKGPR